RAAVCRCRALRRMRAQGGAEAAGGLRGFPAVQVCAGVQGHRAEGRQLAVAGQPARAPGVFRRAPGAAHQRRAGAMNASGFKMYSKASRDAQYELVERYAPLVKRIAYHLLARLPASVQVEDLIQSGMIGLLEVANKYDASKGASFETYAGIRIR